MTEAEWLACSDATEILNFLLKRELGGIVNWLRFHIPLLNLARRQYRRLYLVASSIKQWQDEINAGQQVLPADEGRIHADSLDLFDAEEWLWADGVNDSWPSMPLNWPDPRQLLTNLINYRWLEILPAARDAQSVYCQLFRDIFGNPFHPGTIEPAWREWNGGSVVKLARTIYYDRRWDIMPILGDALEDALCDNADILDHCRGPGPHVRGCWVVDLILGNE